MARAQSGDLDAFEDLVNRHNRRVYRALVGVVGNFDEAQDAMQETFLKAFQHIGSFQGRSKFSTWLLMIDRLSNLEMVARVVEAWGSFHRDLARIGIRPG